MVMGILLDELERAPHSLVVGRLVLDTNPGETSHD
jgi:hypothetical protein